MLWHVDEKKTRLAHARVPQTVCTLSPRMECSHRYHHLHHHQRHDGLSRRCHDSTTHPCPARTSAPEAVDIALTAAAFRVAAAATARRVAIIVNSQYKKNDEVFVVVLSPNVFGLSVAVGTRCLPCFGLLPFSGFAQRQRKRTRHL